MKKHLIGTEKDHILIEVRSTPDSEEWIHCDIEIRNGPFLGRYSLELMAGDLINLKDLVKHLYENLSETVVFKEIEGRLDFEMKGDGRGHIYVKGKATDGLSQGYFMNFSFVFDQTFLPSLISSFEKV